MTQNEITEAIAEAREIIKNAQEAYRRREITFGQYVDATKIAYMDLLYFEEMKAKLP